MIEFILMCFWVPALLGSIATLIKWNDPEVKELWKNGFYPIIIAVCLLLAFIGKII